MDFKPLCVSAIQGQVTCWGCPGERVLRAEKQSHQGKERKGKGDVVGQFPGCLGNAQVGFEAGWCHPCILYLIYSPHWSLRRVNELWCVLCPSACSPQSMKCHWNLLKPPVHSRTFVPWPCCVPVYGVKSCRVLGTALCRLRGIAVPITMISVL